MKVTTTDTPSANTLGYPKLMAFEDVIVLMTSHGHGITLASPDRSIGYCGEVWSMGVFEDYTGTVTLENS